MIHPIFFTGIEGERKPAFGLKTLTGLHKGAMIQKHYDKERLNEHIFFGAEPVLMVKVMNLPEDGDEWVQWENLIKAFLTAGKLCLRYGENLQKYF